MATSVTDSEWMTEAIALARRGTGTVSPNPRVGCVIVRDNHIVSSGWHQRYGEEHAEVNALRNFDGDTDGAVMYVTLEPCSHQGKQGPCTKAIIASGIADVVVGIQDPYHEVAGRGLAELRSAGVRVRVGVCQNECTELNRTFIHHVTTGSSYVAAKIATSVDLAISATPPNRWLTSAESRRVVHELRNEFDAVLTGVGTVIADNPQLTVRDVQGRNPIRLVLDTSLRIPPTSALVTTAHAVPTIIFCAEEYANSSAAATLQSHGVRILPSTLKNGLINLSKLVETTGSMGIASILVEAGPHVLHSFLAEGLVNELIVHVAPALVGSSPRWFDNGYGEAMELTSVCSVGPDVHLRYALRSRL